MGDPPETPRRNLTSAVVPALAAAGLAAVGAIVLVGVNGRDGGAAAVSRECILEGAEGLGGPIDLIDQNGAAVTQANFAGEPALVYFGFTHCPDVCPTSMQAIASALEAPDAPELQTILITVDPARDTPERMREYVTTSGFPAGLIGLTGSQQQIDSTLAEFHAYGRALPPAPGAPADVYNVDHSSFLYVMDASWRPVAAMRTFRRENEADPASAVVPASPQEIGACVAAGLSRSPAT